MNRKFWSILCLTLISLFLLSSIASAQEKFLLRMNHQQTGREPGAKVDQWFADEVTKRTNGQVTIKIYWAGVLGKAKETLKLIQQGGIEMAGLSPAYFPAELPFSTALNGMTLGPIAMKSPRQAHIITHTLLKKVPAFMEEARASRMYPLFFHALGPYRLISKKSVGSFEDLKGMKIRTWGSDLPLLVKAAGMVPVTMFMPEVYEGIMRGIIDAAPFSLGHILNYKIYEVAKNITEVIIWQGTTWGVWVGLDVWNKLPESARKIMTEVAEEAKKMDLEKVMEGEREARKFLEARGVKFHPFSERELKKWAEVSPDLFANWIARMEKIGKGDAARQTITLWKKLRAEIRP